MFAATLARADVEELLARDLVVLDRINADLFERDALSAGLGSNVEGEVDGKLIRPVEERPPRAFDGDHFGGVRHAHHVKIPALVARFHKLPGDILNAHDTVLSKKLYASNSILPIE